MTFIILFDGRFGTVTNKMVVKCFEKQTKNEKFYSKTESSIFTILFNWGILL